LGKVKEKLTLLVETLVALLFVLLRVAWVVRLASGAVELVIVVIVATGLFVSQALVVAFLTGPVIATASATSISSESSCGS